MVEVPMVVSGFRCCFPYKSAFLNKSVFGNDIKYNEPLATAARMRISALGTLKFERSTLRSGYVSLGPRFGLTVVFVQPCLVKIGNQSVLIISELTNSADILDSPKFQSRVNEEMFRRSLSATLTQSKKIIDKD